MHVIGELQIRHSKDRAFIEKVFGWIYRITDVIQLISILVFAAQLTNAFPNTFTNVEFWSRNTYSLSLLLDIKTTNCSALIDGSSVTGFDGLFVNMTRDNSAAVFSLHTERIRLAFAMTAIAFIVSAMNRVLMRHNVFFVPLFGKKLRIHKDVATVLDLGMEIGALVLTRTCVPTAEMLQQYLKQCGVRSEDSVPFVSLAGLFVSASVAVGVHCISIIAVLVVGLTHNKRAESSPSSSDNNSSSSGHRSRGGGGNASSGVHDANRPTSSSDDQNAAGAGAQ